MIKALLPMVVVALLAAGCGGGGKPPSVASLPPTNDGTTTQGTPAESAPDTSSAPSAGSHFSVAMKVPSIADGEKFSACMRSHGLPDFPDPNGQGVIQLGSGSGVDPSSPKFQKAQQACRKVLPNGGRPTPAQIAKAQQAALKFSACMRSHGVKDFPDPSFSDGGVRLKIGGAPGSDLNPSSPIFQKAQAACQGFMAVKGAAPPGAGPK